nr:MAG TPA: hypothetical protein [Bacteriophage sp.]
MVLIVVMFCLGTVVMQPYPAYLLIMLIVLIN